MWKFDVAIYKLDVGEIWEIIAEALRNDVLAKRLGLKKMLVEHMLGGDAKTYKQAVEDFNDAISEYDRYDFYNFNNTFTVITDRIGIAYHPAHFHRFIYDVQNKIEKLDVSAEIGFIADCRAHLTSYDDFLHGLRANQALYEMQETAHQNRMLALEKVYAEKLKLVMQAAERTGVLPQLAHELKLLAGHSDNAEITVTSEWRANEL